MITDIYKRNSPYTLAHTDFLTLIAKYIKPTMYLELGVSDGTNFLQISYYCNQSIAVDIAPLRFTLPNTSTYFNGTTDDFFRTIDSSLKFDLVFIDADHSFQQSLKETLG